MSRESDKNYYQNNRKKVLKRVKKYYEDNKKKKQEYYERNKVRILEVAKQYRITDAYRETIKKYKHSPKGMFADRDVHNRRRIQKNKGKLTNQEWDEILRKHNFRCAYCGLKGNMTIDHVIPISKGGQHLVNNIVPACVECNSRKGARSGWIPNIFKIAIGERND